MFSNFLESNYFFYDINVTLLDFKIGPEPIEYVPDL